MRFEGLIAGFGTSGGRRVVVGLWSRSPFGRFADVMIEEPQGHRVLLAPSAEVASLVADTYRFDEVQVVPVSFRSRAPRIDVRAGDLSVALELGARTGLGRLLRVPPRRLAGSIPWLTAIDPVARVLARGAGTAGTAGGGRREYYGVTDARRLRSARVESGGLDWGGLAPLSPPVRFGFASLPSTPQVVRVTTTIVG
jgi:hypothetical protein